VEMDSAPDSRDFVNLIVAMTKIKRWNDSVCDLLRRMLISSLTSEVYYLRLQTSLEVLQRLASLRWVPRTERNRECIHKLLVRVSSLHDSPHLANVSSKILSAITGSW